MVLYATYYVQATHHRSLHAARGQSSGKPARPGRARRVGVALRTRGQTSPTREPEGPAHDRRSLPLGDGADDGVLSRRLRRDHDLRWRDRRPWDGGAVLGTHRPPLAGFRWPASGLELRSSIDEPGAGADNRRSRGAPTASQSVPAPHPRNRRGRGSCPLRGSRLHHAAARCRLVEAGGPRQGVNHPSLLVFLASPSRPRRSDPWRNPTHLPTEQMR